MSEFCVAGDVLLQSSNLIEAGEGTYIDDGSLRASLTGIVSEVEVRRREATI